ncbi:MAG: capsular polysaccharide biosynthesis protein [Oscillospiraceae bacterium]|nr:capsular polysaccharide biosynthesis protein [Oscillospiraceae bacterium]
MIDFHSHILPKMDDGSRSVEESLELLRESARQGVDTIAATPHFYASQEPPERFLARRAEAWETLKPHLTDEMPRILLGAEVHFFEGIAHAELVPQLKLQGTELLLLEMPFHPWTDRIVSEVVELAARPGVTVVLAHIERYLQYLRFRSRRYMTTLRNSGVLIQSNGEFFLEKPTRSKAVKMLREGKIDLLGSDCHSTDRRPPTLGPASEQIRAALGGSPLETIDRRARALIGEADR